MAVDFGSGNTTKYFTCADDASWTFDTNYTVGCLCRWPSGRTAGSFFQYFFSTGNFAATNSLNVYIGEDSNTLNRITAYHESQSNFLVLSNIDDGAWWLVGAKADSNELQAFGVQLGDTSVQTTTSTTISSGASDGGTVYIGSRADLNTDRMMEGEMQFVFKTDDACTDAELVAIANGASPLILGSRLTNYVDIYDGSNGVELINGLAVTSNGSPSAADGLPVARSAVIYSFPSAAAPAGATPKGPLGHPLHGPLGGPI